MIFIVKIWKNAGRRNEILSILIKLQVRCSNLGQY